MDIIDGKKATVIVNEQKLAHYIRCVLLDANLDNSTVGTQPSQEGEDCMFRGRVPVGINEFNVPIMKQVKAKNEYEFMLKAAQIILESGLIGDYVLRNDSTEVKRPKAISFRDMAEWWFKVYKQDNTKLKPATIDDYRRMLDRVIYPAFGDKPINEITTTNIQELLNDNRSIAASTQNKLLITLRQIFNMAIQESLIVINPAKGKLTKTGADKKEGRALSQDEWLRVQSLLPQLNESDRVLVALMMYEGLRRGEALGLTWDNVDFAENCIHITQQAAFNNGSNTATIQLPKTKKSIRTIPLVKPLKAILETIPAHGDFIVGNSKTPYTKSMLRKAMDRIKRILEIDDLHPHMFRYSHATVLHELGVDDKTIQHWEGHANQATTANIYIKNTQTMTDRAEAILSDFASANA